MDPTPANPTNATDDTDFYLASHYFNKPSQLYAYAFWTVIFLVVCGTKLRLSNRLRRQATPFLRWAIVKHPAAVWGTNLTAPSPDFLPSNGNLLLTSAFFVVLCSLCFLGPDYIPGQGFRVNVPTVQKVVLKSLWTSAARAGLISFCLLPLVVLLGLKSSPAAVFSWRLTVRLYFDKLAIFHKWAARFLYFFTTLHVVLWTVKLGMDTVDGEMALRKAFGKDRFVCGWVAFGTFTLLMASSSTALRKAHYETFYALHVFLFPLVLAMAAFHHPETGWWAWAALILWVVERIWRSGRILRYNCRGALGLSRRYRKVPAPAADSDDVFLATWYRPPPGYAYAELLGGATIRLTYTPAYRVQWVPGQHFLLNIPAISKFTSHPFTCATTTSKPSTPPCQVKMVFLIRAKNGWTKSLWDMVISHAVQRKSYVGKEPPLQEIALPTSGLVLRMFVDGPFGSSVRIPWKDYSSIFIVVGGSGVTFGLSVLEHLCSVLAGTGQQGGDAEKGSVPSTTFRRIRFVWLVREFVGHIQWCASAIKQCKSMLSKDQLQVDIFVTNSKASIPTSINEKSPIASFSGTEMGEPPLLPPLPAFHASGRKASMPFMASNESLESCDSEMGGSYANLGYVPNHPFFQSRDLTDFEGDSEIIIPGEILLSRRIKREGRVRRANTRNGRKSGGSLGSWEPAPSPLSQSSSDHPGSTGELEIRSPPISPNSSPPYIAKERRIASGSSTGSSSISSPGHESRPSWLPLHCSPAQPPRAFAQTVPQLEKGEVSSPIHVRLDARELKDVAILAEDTNPGKPKLARILEYELSEAEGSLLVACCGPISLDALVRENIAAKMAEEHEKRDGKVIAYYSEDFGY
ncbi:hypothetical protein FA13DRAFT_1249679 [Coprinellus micaceus]|uniref:FAD-binding FR-type domain-containing protein n=1 Tax=Coprinellus micaceus TaxID=71717 RepID=A0A4Y7TQ89_COPMI|nr:hypothetical protein FA13DRAFT_1249679 [Coprinellus micaceus]